MKVVSCSPSIVLKPIVAFVKFDCYVQVNLVAFVLLPMVNKISSIVRQAQCGVVCRVDSEQLTTLRSRMDGHDTVNRPSDSIHLESVQINRHLFSLEITLTLT